jgi:hypothetical protein
LIVKRYYGVSFVLSILALAAWMTGRFAYHAPAASDGSGPDGGGLLLLFGAVLVGCLLVHSTLLSLVVWKYRSPSVFGQAPLFDSSIRDFETIDRSEDRTCSR